MDSEMRKEIVEVVQAMVDRIVNEVDPAVANSSNYYFDECAAFVEQVPPCFDLGTVEVRLNCLTMSENYCAIGSQCGALFLFNRKISQSVRPLRTSYDEVITCLRIFSRNDGREFLAVGHRSGTVIVLYLPTSHPKGIRKLKQSILEDVHGGFAIQCLDWASDGKKLFSADANGHVVMTHVDFQNNEFINTTVCEEQEVLYLRSAGEFLAIATDYCYKIVNVSNNCVMVVQRYLEDTFSRISGIAFYKLSQLLLILLQNGEILAHNLSASSGPFKFKNLRKLLHNTESLPRTCSTNSSPRKSIRESIFFGADDFLLARVKSFAGGRILVYYLSSRFFISTFYIDPSGNHRVKVEAFDLNELFGDAIESANNLEILDVVCQGEDELMELFILGSNQQIYRLSALPAPPALVESAFGVRNPQFYTPSVGVLLNSLSTVAQKSGKNFFERFQSTSGSSAGGVSRFVDNFLMGNTGTPPRKSESKNDISASSSNNDSFSSAKGSDEQLKGTPDETKRRDDNGRPESATKMAESDAAGDSGGFKFLNSLNPKSLRLPDEYSSKISSNIQNIFGHLKNTNLLSDYDSQSSRHWKAKDDLISELSSSVATDDLEESVITGDDVDGDPAVTNESESLGRTVNVSRRKKTKLAKKNIPQNMKRDLMSSPVPLVCSPYGESSGLLNRTEVQQENTIIADANLEKILGVIGLAEPSTSVVSSPKDLIQSTNADFNRMEESLFEDDLPSTSTESKKFSDSDGSLQAANELDASIHSEYDFAAAGFEILANIAVAGSKEVVADSVEDYVSLEDSIAAHNDIGDNAPSSPQKHSLADNLEHFKDDGREITDKIGNMVATINEIFHDVPDEMENQLAEPDALFDTDDEGDKSADIAKLISIDSNISTSSNNVLNFNADYPLISARMGHVIENDDDFNNRWLLLPAVHFGTVGTFYTSADYIFVCPPSSVLAFLRHGYQQPQLFRVKEWLQDPNMGSWEPTVWDTKFATSAIAANDNSTIVWRVVDGLAYMAKGSRWISKLNTSLRVKWEIQTSANEGAISEIAFAGHTAWYLTKKGVFVQMKLPEMGIFYRPECPFALKELTASENAVWALRVSNGNLVIRSGLQHCPMGVDWVEDSLGNGLRFVSISLFNRFGFGLNKEGELWMNDNVTKNTPFGSGAWYKIESFDLAILELANDCSKRSFLASAAREKWRIRATSKHLLVSFGSGGHFFLAPTPIYGHLLANTIPPHLAIYNNFEFLTATGYCSEANDYIYAVDKGSCREVFSYSVSRQQFMSLPPISRAISDSFNKVSREKSVRWDKAEVGDSREIPCFEAIQRKIAAITASRERIFVVDDAGDCLMYSTVGSNPQSSGRDSRSDGYKEWICLPRPDKKSRFVSVAASSVSLWAVDCTGRIFFTPSVLFDTSNADEMTDIWTSIPPPPAPYQSNEVGCDRKHRNSKLNIRVSPSWAERVWVFDSLSGACWARIDITLDNLQGNTWSSPSSSIQVEELAVGDKEVWALKISPNGTGPRVLYKRIGLDMSTNGHSWMAVMITNLSRISIDGIEGRIWGLDHAGTILRHEAEKIQMKMYDPETSPSRDETPFRRSTSGENSEYWEYPN